MADWKYKTLRRCRRHRRRTNRTRQYYSKQLAAIPFVSDRQLGNGARVISVREQEHADTPPKISSSVMTQIKLKSPQGWTFIYLSDLAQAKASARAAAAFSCVLLGFFMLLFFYLRQRRAAVAQKLRPRRSAACLDNLEAMVEERTSDSMP